MRMLRSVLLTVFPIRLMGNQRRQNEDSRIACLGSDLRWTVSQLGYYSLTNWNHAIYY